MIFVGIDYSMKCPAITIYEDDGGEWNPKNCKFRYFIDCGRTAKGDWNKKAAAKWTLEDGQVKGIAIPEWTSSEHRYDLISSLLLSELVRYSNKEMHISLEGYAMGAKGTVFNIGENGGVLKHKIYLMGQPIHIYAPTTIKLFACDHGAATKDMMYDKFFKETRLDLKKILKYNRTVIDSPLGDVADSYFICKKLYEDYRHQHAGFSKSGNQDN